MFIETDLKRIEQIAAEKEDENWEFRVFLKQLDMPRAEIDALVHQINEDVTSQIDCTQCANCCQQIRPVLDQGDVAEFSKGLKMAVPEFKDIHLYPLEDDRDKYEFNKLPCPFLEDNLCTNYERRPTDCRSYPHLHKDNFVSRLWGVLGNYAVCPIVFNVYEQLKIELWR